MGRLNLEPDIQPAETDILNRLIDEYGTVKATLNEMDKSSKSLNNQIKEIFRERGIEEHLTENNKATVKVSYREKLDEEKAIEILRKELSEEDFKLAVKTREYIDDDALSELTFNKKFDARKLEECICKGEPIYTLNVKALSKKKLMEDK